MTTNPFGKIMNHDDGGLPRVLCEKHGEEVNTVMLTKRHPQFEQILVCFSCWVERMTDGLQRYDGEGEPLTPPTP